MIERFLYAFLSIDCNMHFISLGDHCAVAEILKDLSLRKKSYPFDWIAKTNLLKNSNIPYNIEIIKWLIKTRDPRSTTDCLLSDFYKDAEKVNSQKIWFPHDEGSKEEIMAKYERRFQRLFEDITQTEIPCIFFMITRKYTISPEIIDTCIDTLLSYHPESKVYLISGESESHDYLQQNPKYREKVVFHFVEYDVSKFYDYDYTDFRPNIKKYIENTFCK